jgi:predicted alpha/beta hydrolase family esterase
MNSDATVLIVPGLREHVPEHWQTLLAAQLPKVRTVPPLERAKLDCAARVAALELAVQAIEGPVLLVAHSAGVMMVVHWALNSRARAATIRGALLATPADVETHFPEGYPTRETLREHGWLPIPRQPLPFPSLVAASRNDPLCAFARAQVLAHHWGSAFEDIGEAGHLNPAAGFGDWPAAQSLLARLDRPGETQDCANR